MQRIILIALALAPGTLPAQSTLAIGAPAPAFSLPGVDGKTHKLNDYAKAKVLAVVFTCNSCPEAELAESRLSTLFHDYREQGVALVAINPNHPAAVRPEEQAFTDVSDSLDDMKLRAEFRHLDYPYLFDGGEQDAASKYGPSVLPQIFLFGRDRKLSYTGRIADARSAVDAMLAGQPLPAAATPSGCPVKWKAQAAAVTEELARLDAAPVALAKAGADELKKLRGNSTGKLLLVNFWATWCGPCVGEFPDLIETWRMYRERGLELVTVSENDPAESAAVLKFLQKQHAAATNLVFGSADTSAMQEAFDHNMGAGVPFTVVITADGDVVYQEEGEMTTAAMRRAILANLPAPKDYPELQAYWQVK